MSRDKNTQSFKNVDNKRLTYTFWSLKPKTTATERECVRQTNKMEWAVTKCDDRLPYICKINKEKVEEEIFVGNCSEGWEHFNGRCYKYFSGKLSWPEARKSCGVHGGDLATVNSYQIQNHLQFLVRSTKTQVWIGKCSITIIKLKTPMQGFDLFCKDLIFPGLINIPFLFIHSTKTQL